MTDAPVALTYNQYVIQVGTMTVVNLAEVSGVWQGASDSPQFTTIIPAMLNYAELRIQRDLDLLPLLTDSTYDLTIGSNKLSIPVGDFVTTQDVALVIDDELSPLTPVTASWLRNVYGSNNNAGPPEYFCMYGGDRATAGNTSNIIQVGPWPDQAYTVNITGTQRMPSLYQYASSGPADTGTTFISAFLPDMLLQASMIYISQYQRNFLPTSNDPNSPGSFENQYGNLLKGALVEEARKRYAASGWSSMAPVPVASPNR